MGVRFVSYLYHILDQEIGMYFNSWITWHYTGNWKNERIFTTPRRYFNVHKIRTIQVQFG